MRPRGRVRSGRPARVALLALLPLGVVLAVECIDRGALASVAQLPHTPPARRPILAEEAPWLAEKQRPLELRPIRPWATLEAAGRLVVGSEGEALPGETIASLFARRWLANSAAGAVRSPG